jgi:bifunctional DNA-binding transcriptional regulator/antitoxin component of YhaV-PrlF toxin-antitoxin module
VTDYKKYSLGQVENFLYDAMSTDATPQEIYDVIKGVVEDNYYTYKNQTENAYELLALLNGNGKGHLTCDKDDTSEKCKKSWNDFWEEPSQYTDEELDEMCDSVTSAKQGKVRTLTHQEAIDAGRSLRDEGIWMSSQKKDKVTKWIIPVDDDYNITFPEDLLEQTGWKEGDVLEWIDQGDGSFKMVKKESKASWVKGNELARVKTYQEMIDDGWEMTADGFWIKEN